MKPSWTRRPQASILANICNENQDKLHGHHENVTMVVLTMLVWDWQCSHSPHGPHWRLCWVKFWGQKKKEREREVYTAAGDIWGILRDNWVKSRRKRCSAWSRAVRSSKICTVFRADQGNMGNSDGNRFFKIIYLFLIKIFKYFSPFYFGHFQSNSNQAPWSSSFSKKGCSMWMNKNFQMARLVNSNKTSLGY